MLLPAFVPYAVFVLLPIGWLLYYSLFGWNGVTKAQFVGLDNYERVFRDGEWWASVVNTLQFAAGRLLIEVPLGLALAYVFFGLRGGTVVVHWPAGLAPRDVAGSWVSSTSRRRSSGGGGRPAARRVRARPLRSTGRARRAARRGAARQLGDGAARPGGPPARAVTRFCRSPVHVHDRGFRAPG